MTPDHWSSVAFGALILTIITLVGIVSIRGVYKKFIRETYHEAAEQSCQDLCDPYRSTTDVDGDPCLCRSDDGWQAP